MIYISQCNSKDSLFTKLTVIECFIDIYLYNSIMFYVPSSVTEEQALHQIYLDETYGAINKDSEEEKSKYGLLLLL